MTVYTATLRPATSPLRTLTVTGRDQTWFSYLSTDSDERCSEVVLPALDWLPYGDWHHGDDGTLTINVTKNGN